MINVHSTKAFVNMPCAHAQWFDLNEDGTPGHCAAIHGYDRTVKLTFSGYVDDHGWLVPFGKLQRVKKFLEYYFDHTTVLPADDPRIMGADLANSLPHAYGGLISNLRILPYGVSMEMSSLFIWEHVNPFIKFVTEGRAYVSKVESIEHERNSAYIDVMEPTAASQARAYFSAWKTNKLVKTTYGEYLLPEQSRWEFIPPKTILNRIANTGF